MFSRRFATRHQPLDWRDILIKLNAKGMSYDALGKMLGRSGNSLRHITSKDFGHPPEWDHAYALLDLFVMLHEEDGSVVLPLLVPKIEN